MNLFSILQSPDDGTPIRPDLTSEGGIRYEQTASGILILRPRKPRPSDAVYSCPMFARWNSIVRERITYYTQKKSIAGWIANWGYRCLDEFNRRPESSWILDIGCGDGAHVCRLQDRSTYIGLDSNLERLEILKKNHPETTAIYGDAASLPFKSGVIGRAFSSNAFEHLWYLKDAVLELHRCISRDGRMIIVIPTEGGLWNLGRLLLSKPHFRKRHPDIDFEFISHVEHCNEARQVLRTLETFFRLRKSYKPTGLPTVLLNAFIEIRCVRRNEPDLEWISDQRSR